MEEIKHQSSNVFHVSGVYQPLMRMLGLDGEAVFDHPRIACWRRLPERENCTLDADLADGRHVRLHVKRYSPVRRAKTPAAEEVNGHRLLTGAGIPTAPLVGWGNLKDGRSFVIFDDLTGYMPADKLLDRGAMTFNALLEPTADLAARLHDAGLHHRDLYLCHFMTRTLADQVDVKLIDPARVRRLPGVLTRNRWIVKDLAQFWYSTLKLPITNEQRSQWLQRYAQQRAGGNRAGGNRVNGLRRQIERKSRSIARHDRRLHRDRPERDASIPQ